MKLRLAAAALALALPLASAVPAAAETAGYAAYTDIVADINGHSIRSYNVEGYTAVVAEDLRAYGFYAIWNPEARTLSVQRARGQDGGPETPYQWPSYDPGPLTHPIGSRARDIYTTDIVTYVAGQKVESFCLDGETLILIDSLAPYGTVVWNPEARTISLTLGDPMAIRLEALKTNAEQWKQTAGPESSWELHEGKKGTLFTAVLTGTPQGDMSQMVYVDRLGNTLDILSLLPQGGLGAAYYASPRNIQMSEEDVITFDTPVLETVAETGETREWGDTRCTVYTDSGRAEFFPLQGEAASWSAQYRSGEWTKDPDVLDVTAGRAAAGGGIQNLGEIRLPGDAGDLSLNMNQNGISITLRDSFVLNSAFAGSGFGRVWNALEALNLPKAGDEGFSPANTPEQKAAAAAWLQVTLNGQPLSGSLWRGRGNGHSDLYFDFDAPVALGAGDALRVHMSMPG